MPKKNSKKVIKNNKSKNNSKVNKNNKNNKNNKTKNNKSGIVRILECGKKKCSKVKNTKSCMKKHCLKLIKNTSLNNMKNKRDKIQKLREKTKKCSLKHCKQYLLDKPKMSSCIKSKCKKDIQEFTKAMLE
jgi:hypothetical protein